MPQATHAAFDARIGIDEDMDVASVSSAPALADIRLAIHGDLAGIEKDWRSFEQIADGTVFQTFDWLLIWQHHIGSHEGVSPAIVTGRDRSGRLLFLFPLAIEGGFARRLTWLGSDLCDYNGPLLAPDFGNRFDATRFHELWREIETRLLSHPDFHFDVVTLDKMQSVIGSQPNPFIGLGVTSHANGAYRMALSGDWEQFYAVKRSASTRRRDRTKRKKLGEFGEVKFVNPTDVPDVAATLDALMVQKSASFAAMGVTDIFALPGYRAFYHALAQKRGFVHVSRLDAGSQIAAANLGLMFRGCYYHLLASYDGGEMSKFGPGAAHMHDLLRRAIEQGNHTFDFTIGDERYKQEWCEGQVTLFDHVSAVTARGLPTAVRTAVIGRVKHLIKQTPALWDMAYKLRAFIGPLMQRLRS